MATVTETVVPERATGTAADHFRAAARVLVGGVSGSARVNPALDHPLLAAGGDGARLIATDGRRYLDFHTGYGATILGPQPPGGAGGYRTGAGYGSGARPGDRLPATAGCPVG